MNKNTINKRGQMEMVGLVFIVVIIVIGVVLYASAIGSKDTSKTYKDTVEKQKSPTFLTALATADVADCSNRPFQEVIGKCIRNERYCSGGDACSAAQDFMSVVADNTLKEQGVKYDLFIKDRTDLRVNDRCDSFNKNNLTYAGKIYPIDLGTGDTATLVLVICR